jgi:hydrogenase maturation protease
MESSSAHPAVAILGLGNLLLTDDGVGVHVVRRLRKDPPDNVVVAEIGTAALRAQELLEEADVVIAIDAVKGDGPPGSIYRFDGVDARVQRRISLHGLGIIEVLRLLPEHSRPEVIILGVEPETIDYGTDLSPAVQAVLPGVAETARRIAQQIKQRRPLPAPHKKKARIQP